jgi:cell division cycle 20-like protein 1 (cofactor of APC complex)
LCDLADSSDSITSVNWNPEGTTLAVGTNKGIVQLYDAHTSSKIREFKGHTARVGSLSWGGDNILTSGSRDRMIFHHDLRVREDIVMKLDGHKQEVCGLKWNYDYKSLASGGNDNKLLIWDARKSNKPITRFSAHEAAVKAIAWSPIQNGLLASGGGTADRHIRFWNTLTQSNISSHDTGSQVCNLFWSKHTNELVSTHGYSQNQIVVWKYPKMTPLATLTGHTLRVLYLAMSPDGTSIVTGAGDETLRFWSVFNKGKSEKSSSGKLEYLNTMR